MPWGWAPRHEVRAQSHAEPSSTTPWKEQEAQVLKRLLVGKKGRFNTGGFPNDEAKLVYLQEQARAGVREEAEADLVHGFRAWLQGTHPENKPGRTDTYQNKPDGRPHRRRMDGTRYAHERTEWQSTPWNDAQLTHLPGVREWLREEAIATDKADLEMQLLAEYGPHDLESAWRYYKHWVLKRPISYPHAHAKGWDSGNWHGPGLASEANPMGWAPRRSTHFDALPEPPGNLRPSTAAASGNVSPLSSNVSPLSANFSPPSRAYEGLPAPDAELAYVAPPEFGLFSPVGPKRSRWSPTPSDGSSDEPAATGLEAEGGGFGFDQPLIIQGKRESRPPAWFGYT